MEGSNQTSQNQTGNNQGQSGFTDPVFAKEINVSKENNPQNNAENPMNINPPQNNAENPMNINPLQNNAGNNNILNSNYMQYQFQEEKNLGNNTPGHNLNKDNNGPHPLDSLSEFTDKGEIQNQKNGPNQQNVNESLSIFNKENQQDMSSQNGSNINNNNINNNNLSVNSNNLTSSN